MDVTAIISKVTRVALYRSMALVTREARVQGEYAEGGTAVFLGGLPFKLDDSSVRVRLSGRTPGRILDLHVELDLGERKGSDRTPGEETLRQLARRQAELRLARRREETRIAFLLSLAPSSREELKKAKEREQARVAFLRLLAPGGGKDGDPPTGPASRERRLAEPWLQLATFVREEVVAARSRLRPLEMDLLDLQDEISQTRHRIAEESRAVKEQMRVCRKGVRLLIESRAPELEIELSYMVPDACWVPHYDLRVDEKGETAELGVLAFVAQLSGDDWTAVKLHLSTADLLRSVQLPELDSWRIGKAQPPKGSGWRELPPALGQLFIPFDEGRGSVPAPALPGAIDLPSMPSLETVVPVAGGGGDPAIAAALAEVAGEPAMEELEMMDALDGGGGVYRGQGVSGGTARQQTPGPLLPPGGRGPGRGPQGRAPWAREEGGHRCGAPGVEGGGPPAGDHRGGEGPRLSLPEDGGPGG